MNTILIRDTHCLITWQHWSDRFEIITRPHFIYYLEIPDKSFETVATNGWYNFQLC